MRASSGCFAGLALAASALHGASVAASDSGDMQAVVAYAKGQLAGSVARLGQRIEYCNAISEDREPPSVDVSAIESPEVSRSDIVESIGYLAVRNALRCEKRARQQVAWDVEKLAIATTDLGIEAPDVEGISRALVYPSAMEIRSEAAYAGQPASLRTYLEKAVGTRPFDPVEVIARSKIGSPGSE